MVFENHLHSLMECNLSSYTAEILTRVQNIVDSCASHCVRIMTRIRRQGRRKLEDQRTDVFKNMCIGVVD